MHAECPACALSTAVLRFWCMQVLHCWSAQRASKQLRAAAAWRNEWQVDELRRGFAKGTKLVEVRSRLRVSASHEATAPHRPQRCGLLIVLARMRQMHTLNASCRGRCAAVYHTTHTMTHVTLQWS